MKSLPVMSFDFVFLFQFVEKFKEVKELTRQAATKAAGQTNGQTEVNHSAAHPPPETNSNSPVNVAKVTQVLWIKSSTM